VLQQIVQVVTPALRREDLLARYENDCFAIFPQNPDESAAVVLAQRVRRAVKYHHFAHEGVKIPVTVCIGIGVLTKKVKNALGLIKDVQAQLDRARSKGRDNINGSQSIRSILRHLAQQRVA
jgi:diguanylate cyclase (GGDEF)-like protein